MRKLATIERIENLRQHPNADALELATIRGWQVVTRRNEFKEGDQCVYCEIDSVLPERQEFEFLRDRKFRIKTIKLRGELSQGIAFPMEVLPFNNDELNLDSWHDPNRLVGMDVTDELGVTLYQPPIPACLGGDVEGSFPSFIPKTDCERIQNHSWILDEWCGVEWGVTEKLDGSSVSIWYDDCLRVCSRNWELRESETNAFWQAANRLELKTKLAECKKFAFQGELIGPKVQGNRYAQSHYSIRFFDVYDTENQRYLDFDDQRELCQRMGLECVPLIDERTHLGDSGCMNVILEAAEGKSLLNPKTEREGLVWRPMKERHDPRIGRVTFKVISNKFLLSDRS